jgi:lipopolysaccharide heptosyltransferase I
MNILIVRLGALGDVVHAVPAAAALRASFPAARIDWLVDARHRPFVDLVTVVDRAVVVGRSSVGGWTGAVRQLRQVRYDVALDFQGLLKSAVLARASGAARVIGFSIWHLREKTARPFYSEALSERSESTGEAPDQEHVIHKNLRLLRTIGVDDDRIAFPLADVDSPALASVRAAIGDAPFALVNPGAAWPNKRWPPERFGEVAAFLRDVRGLTSIVLWGPGEEALARAVAQNSAGSGRVAPATTIPDLLALSRRAALTVSGDTGPLHIAAAAGTPTVAIFGPTNPGRNGPWSASDVVVSRYTACGCHYDRRCHQSRWCLDDVSVAEVTAAIQQRLSIHG